MGYVSRAFKAGNYESNETSRRFLQQIPIIARLDGKAFHSFCKMIKAEKPFDDRLVETMRQTSRLLAIETNANMAYTQSDEITLVWYSASPESSVWFDGKPYKILSVLSSYASVIFNRLFDTYMDLSELDVSKMPVFDCRAFNVPTLIDGVEVFQCREDNARCNSVQMAARAVFSHNQCHEKKIQELRKMLLDGGINWEDYPNRFKNGTYVQRKKTKRKFTTNEIEALPPKHEARKNPDLVIERTDFEFLDVSLGAVENKIGVVYFGEDVKVCEFKGV